MLVESVGYKKQQYIELTHMLMGKDREKRLQSDKSGLILLFIQSLIWQRLSCDILRQLEMGVALLLF